VAWGADNRTCGLRLVGHGPSFRVESRIPGADANSYIAFAGLIAAGLEGIEQGLDPGPEYEGSAYEATDVPRIPGTLIEAIELLEDSTLAMKAFGLEVHHHLVNTARQEWLAAQRVVTDWELERSFERF
jgi:glutamine synthetase